MSLYVQLCFIRQLWSSINRAEYIALLFGFITAHGLPLTYDFYNYMIWWSMEEEFRDIVGIGHHVHETSAILIDPRFTYLFINQQCGFCSVPLWIYAILCIILDFHGSPIYNLLLAILPSLDFDTAARNKAPPCGSQAGC
ncbi:hypothetical protein SAY87_017028 [Trapa incisa]|uniref:Uncharacterized protein n=1 Tax=Trapa incisa TaxID=236973 RepID=A0AAN7LIW6_9MYRT|nr:hypothetical protein SAY87_017028 [Trapa incisa]